MLNAPVQTYPALVSMIHRVGSENAAVIVGEDEKVVGVASQKSAGLLVVGHVVNLAPKAGAVNWLGRESNPEHGGVEFPGGLRGGS